MSATSLMPNTCTLTPMTYSKSTASGGMVPTAGTAVTGVTCGIQTMSGFEAVEHKRETGTRGFNCYFPIGTTITTAYRISAITGGSIGGLSSVILEVTSPPQDHAGRGTYLMVTAKEIQA